MTRTDVERVQTYLRRLFGTERIQIIPPAKPGLSVEIAVSDEVIGTVHQDTEDGETSYSIHITVLEEDLPPLPKPSATAGRPRVAPRR